MGLQPFLHHLIPTLMAPTQVWSDRDGQVRDEGAQGVFHGDLRALTHAIVTVNGIEPEALSASAAGPGRAEAIFAVRQIDGEGADPTTWLRRSTTVRPGNVQIRLALECATSSPVAGRLELALGSDLASLEVVKQGERLTAAKPNVDQADPSARVDFTGATSAVGIRARGADVDLRGDGVVLGWDAAATPGSPFIAEIEISIADSSAVVTGPAQTHPEWVRPQVSASDPRLARLLDRSLDDLSTLRMTWTKAPQEVFLAAGAPWFFTLFGRDSIWASRLLLPLGTDLARGTLRTLAVAQGLEKDPATAEQPGKILHEVRPAHLALGDGTVLPPIYYGTVDATALWICLLHDAWRWGMEPADVEALLPALDSALGWLRDHGDGNGDGFIDYVDETGSGLANQGWKDSGDSVQWRDGTLAQGPIALVEVQAYAYEAAMAGAALIEAFGRDGASDWRAWAGDLEQRFRAAFWTTDEQGPYLGIALDRHGKLVDSVASNMGHVIGTGILTPDEERIVADRLVSPTMSSGFGLRTLASDMGGYWPLRYHGGAVWAHDTAIAIRGLNAAGLDDQADVLIAGLLAAAERVDYQLPELFSGLSPLDGAGLVPYPASCHPQAWSAAASVTILEAVLGLAPGEREGRGDASAPRVRTTGRDVVGEVTASGLPGPHGPWSVALVPGAPTVTT